MRNMYYVKLVNDVSFIFLKLNQPQEEEEAEEEEMGVAETYAEYWPAKRKIVTFIVVKHKGMLSVNLFQ